MALDAYRPDGPLRSVSLQMHLLPGERAQKKPRLAPSLSSCRGGDWDPHSEPSKSQPAVQSPKSFNLHPISKLGSGCYLTPPQDSTGLSPQDSTQEGWIRRLVSAHQIRQWTSAARAVFKPAIHQAVSGTRPCLPGTSMLTGDSVQEFFLLFSVGTF